ncbi:MAG: DHA2 family efflux MFS transporter permease subunit [Reyranellaceae bacterium]
MSDAAPGPFSMATLRRAVLEGHEPPPAPAIARLASYRWLVVGTVCIGAFMGQVDASLTQMLLPQLEREFGARLSAVSWVAVAYLLAMASFMPIYGRLADMIGRKLLYTSGFLLFIFGSALCGFASDLLWLVIFRVLQGAGAALITANSIAIVVLATNPEERGRALGLQSAAQAIGLGAGPAIGGLVLDTLGWHWAFWINVPVGLAGAVIGWLVLPQSGKPATSEKFDWHGAVLIAPALTCLVALLNEGYTWGPTSPAFIACAVLAVLFLFLFFRTERRAASPLLDLELLGRKPFLIGNLANFLCYACLFGVFFVIPFVLVRVYQDSALAAGLRLSILPVMLGLTAPIGGALSDRFGSRTPTTAGMLVCVVALVVLHLFLDGSVANLTMVTLALGLFGVGQGLFVSPNSSAVMGLAPPELTGEAGSVLNVMRFLGVSAGIASSSTVLALSLGMMRGGVASTVTAPAPILIDASRSVIVLLICLAAGAGLLSLVRPGKPAPRSERTFVPE